MRERKRERERGGDSEGKKNQFFAYKGVIQITSLLGQRDFANFCTTDVLTGT
jgi:hypothetical protein